jgi:hypothetical protein
MAVTVKELGQRFLNQHVNEAVAESAVTRYSEARTL